MRYLFGIALIFLCSCDGPDYFNLLTRSLAPELREHLPTNVNVDGDNISIRIPHAPEFNRITANQTTLMIEWLDQNAENIADSLSKTSLATYSFSDSCLLVIYRYQRGATKGSPIGREWLYDSWLKKNKDCFKDKIPIPNFIDIKKGKNCCGFNCENGEYKYGLPYEYEIFVTEAKKDKHFPDRYYGHKVPLPKQWERGYSKGFATNPNTNHVVFWLTIW